MARTGLLEVHGDFRHLQTNINCRPLTKGNQRGSNDRFLKLDPTRPDSRRPEVSPGYLIPSTAVRGAWRFIRLWI
jgi:hypothetical protein